jgi:hypothetical protein
MRSAKAVVLVVVASLVSSMCVGGLGTIRYVENEAISEELREQIHGLNAIVLDGLVNGDASEILSIYVNEARSRPGFEAELNVLAERAAPVLAKVDTELFHEFDITCSRKNPQHTWAVVFERDVGFIVHVNAIQKRMFYSVMTTKGSFEDKLIGVHYVLEDDSWRVFDLRVQPYRVGGRSAHEWGDEAQALMEQGLAVPASLRFSVAKSIIRPLPQIQYVKEGELLKLGKRIADEIATLPQLPLTLEELPSQPTVYFVTPHFVDRKIVAVVQYVSRLERDEGTLAAEVVSIAESLAEKLPGLCASSEYVAYRAFSEAPVDPNTQYEYFGIAYDCRTGRPAI